VPALDTSGENGIRKRREVLSRELNFQHRGSSAHLTAKKKMDPRTRGQSKRTFLDCRNGGKKRRVKGDFIPLFTLLRRKGENLMGTRFLRHKAQGKRGISGQRAFSSGVVTYGPNKGEG